MTSKVQALKWYTTSHAQMHFRSGNVSNMHISDRPLVPLCYLFVIFINFDMIYFVGRPLILSAKVSIIIPEYAYQNIVLCLGIDMVPFWYSIIDS